MKFRNTTDALQMMIRAAEFGDRRYRVRMEYKDCVWWRGNIANCEIWRALEEDSVTMPLDVAIMRVIQAAEGTFAFAGPEIWSRLEIVEAK